MSFTVSGIIGAIKRDGQIVFSTLATDIEAAGAAVLKAVGPAAKAFVDQEVSVAKQFASDAITKADSYLGSHQQAIALATEQAIETEVSILTGGKSVPLNGLTAEGVDQLVAAAVSAAHNAGLALKAWLATPAVQSSVQAAAQAPSLQAVQPPPPPLAGGV